MSDQNNLDQAKAEMMAIIKKYDLCGYITLFGKGGYVGYINLETTWTAFKMLPAGGQVRFVMPNTEEVALKSMAVLESMIESSHVKSKELHGLFQKITDEFDKLAKYLKSKS